MYRFLFLLLLWVFGVAHSANAQSVLYQKFTAPTSETMVQSLTDERLNFLQNQFQARTELQRREQLTRWEFLEIVIEASGCIECRSTKNTTHFSDIKWRYEGLIAFAYNNNIINGYPDGTFKPNNPISRAEATKILVQALNIPLASAQTQFNDIPASNTLGRYIQTAYNNKLLNGTSPTTFNPNATISRGELIKIVYNIQVGTGMERIINPSGDVSEIKYANIQEKGQLRATGYGQVEFPNTSYGVWSKIWWVNLSANNQKITITSLQFKILSEQENLTNIQLTDLIDSFEGDVSGYFKKTGSDTFEYILSTPIQLIPRAEHMNSDSKQIYFKAKFRQWNHINPKFIEIYLQNVIYNWNVVISENKKLPQHISKISFAQSEFNKKLIARTINTKQVEWTHYLNKIGEVEFSADESDVEISSFVIKVQWDIRKDEIAELKFSNSNSSYLWYGNPIDSDNNIFVEFYYPQKIAKWEKVTYPIYVRLKEGSVGRYNFSINKIITNAWTIIGLPLQIGSMTTQNDGKWKLIITNYGSLSHLHESPKEYRVHSGIWKAEFNDITINSLTFKSNYNLNNIKELTFNTIEPNRVEIQNNVITVYFDSPLIIKKWEEKDFPIDIVANDYNDSNEYNLTLIEVQSDGIINQLPLKSAYRFQFVAR